MQNDFNKTETLILYNSVEYFKELLKDRGYNIFSTFGKETLFYRIQKKIIKKLSFKEESLLNKQWIRKLKSTKTVILFAPVEDSVIQFIKNRNPDVDIKYWYWNPAYRIGRPTDLIYNLTDAWTFDKNDAKNYKLKYNNTFYIDTIKIENIEVMYDIVFVGRNKHRKDKLINLQELFKEKGFSTYFHIIPNRNENNTNEIKELPYPDYLKLLSKSKAILDIMPPSQVGLTLRPMESIFHNIKLITDNIEILNEPFYNSQNIFVLGYDDESSLEPFLNAPYIPLSKEIIKMYTFEHWIDRLIDNQEFVYT